MDFNDLKLVIWDLDDTFWTGTLSEGEIFPLSKNLQLVKDLTDRGIINSICSKNDLKPTLKKLKELTIDNFFVFKSINWDPKGPRISELLKEIGLRAKNTLFIDDNLTNLNEAKHYEPELHIATPEIIHDLINFVSKINATDLSHSRLKNYMILEEKKISQKSYSDNLEFLFNSNTIVSIHRDCDKNVDRIHELIQRTNQLNFTKKRITKDELCEIINDKNIDTGYIKVKDKFGDYGIVGFFAVNSREAIHFLFSCRTIGQGVEQFVYAELGFPEIKVSGNVITELNKKEKPKWINQNIDTKIPHKISDTITGKIIFKGPCDLMGVTSYLKARDMVSELTYFSPVRKNNIEHQSTITNFINIPNLDKNKLDILVNKCIFNDEEMYKTSLYDNDVKLIFLSTLHEFHFGIYKHKSTGLKLAFGEWNHPLTDPEEWDNYINNKVWTASNNFTYSFLKDFSNEWEFMGRKKYEEYIEELKIFLSLISEKATVCLLLGSEKPFLGSKSDAWFDREKIHYEINRIIREFAKDEPQVKFIDYTDFINSSHDYTDSINHFQRNVSYKIAQEVNKIIEEVMGKKIKQTSTFKILIDQTRDVISGVHMKIKDLLK